MHIKDLVLLSDLGYQKHSRFIDSYIIFGKGCLSGSSIRSISFISGGFLYKLKNGKMDKRDDKKNNANKTPKKIKADKK